MLGAGERGRPGLLHRGPRPVGTLVGGGISSCSSLISSPSSSELGSYLPDAAFPADKGMAILLTGRCRCDWEGRTHARPLSPTSGGQSKLRGSLMNDSRSSRCRSTISFTFLKPSSSALHDFNAAAAIASSYHIAMKLSK